MTAATATTDMATSVFRRVLTTTTIIVVVDVVNVLRLEMLAASLQLRIQFLLLLRQGDPWWNDDHSFVFCGVASITIMS